MCEVLIVFCVERPGEPPQQPPRWPPKQPTLSTLLSPPLPPRYLGQTGSQSLQEGTNT